MEKANPQTLKINEIFHSIQGESSLAGYPTTFVRTSGCHLRCTYCDTTYAYNEGRMMDFQEILATVKKNGAPYVCVTGGEPLLQKNILPFLSLLSNEGFQVSLETSGDLDCTQVDERVLKVIDVKTPDSGEPNKFNFKNIDLAGPKTEFKFVICSEGDFEWAENFSKENKLYEKSIVLYSPSFNKIDEKWLAKKILSEKSSARLQLQLHKYIWSFHARGV
ncbi:MAG TPA: 7-carboxy-7-deazaguanine synthase QueE [Bdellovibrionales bacterium]|nr:7-carboxy-7-deazaguanine synthase QueE [Pseudobdellovibrionaceae bacterium]HAG91564.1 7-carboxy-7-deazaguanine synthase QueE [Bdellovibrionales bacterium]|tara:strand:+ start:1789 stop:2448 length:660 start_codon:yes stop_codon:yes gene_type:complete